LGFCGGGPLFGASAGDLPLRHEVFPRIPFRQLWRETALGLLLRFPPWVIYLAAAVLMPEEFGAATLVILAVVVGWLLIWAKGG
jgi:hypothetical protein